MAADFSPATDVKHSVQDKEEKSQEASTTTTTTKSNKKATKNETPSPANTTTATASSSKAASQPAEEWGVQFSVLRLPWSTLASRPSTVATWLIFF